MPYTRYWESITKWNEAIQLTPENEVLHEMKAQVLKYLYNYWFPLTVILFLGRLRNCSFKVQVVNVYVVMLMSLLKLSLY